MCIRDRRKEAAEAERAEARRLAEARQAEIERARARRKAESAQLKKRTKKGQPVLAAQIESMLGKIERQAGLHGAR